MRHSCHASRVAGAGAHNPRKMGVGAHKPRTVRRTVKLSGTASSGRAARCPGNRGGGDGNRTRVQGFAGPCLSHSATPPQGACRKGIRTSESGRRDSNPRPSPWQGDALPTEPRPRRAPWGCDQNCSRSCRSRKLGLPPASPQVSGIVRVAVHSGHVLRALGRRPGRAARPVTCGRTSHFVAQQLSVIFRCRSKNT